MRIIDTFSYYDTLAMRTAHHPTGGERALLYCAVALGGEVGEVQNEVKKIARDDNGILTEDRRNKIIDEIGDVLWYLNSLANEIGSTLQWCATKNIEKLEARHGVVAEAGYSPAPERVLVSAAGDGVHL